MQTILREATRRLESLKTGFAKILDVEEEVTKPLLESGTQAALLAATTLRAAGVETAYTGIESVLKGLVVGYDGDVFAELSGWHAQLLRQASQVGHAGNRGTIISSESYDGLNRLRAFRHIERTHYSHLLRTDDVGTNFKLMLAVVPRCIAEIDGFLSRHSA